MLGHKLAQTLNNKFEVFGTVRKEPTLFFSKLKILDQKNIFQDVDAAHFNSIEKVFLDLAPDVIINCVGIVKQLQNAENIVESLRINAIFPHLLRELISKSQTKLITISTDCVFSGKKGNYKETDTTDAEDVYGKSKNLGEITDGNCLTIRTSIIGRELTTSHGLIDWFLGNKGRTVKGFSNAVFSGFPTIILAQIISDIIENHQHLRGLYHISAKPINKYDLLSMVRDAYKIDIQIERDENFKIDRSLNSDKFRDATNYNPPDWNEMVQAMVNDKTVYDE